MKVLVVQPNPDRPFPNYEMFWVLASDGKWKTASSIISTLWGSSDRCLVACPPKNGTHDKAEDAVRYQLERDRRLIGLHADNLASRMADEMENLISREFGVEVQQMDLFA